MYLYASHNTLFKKPVKQINIKKSYTFIEFPVTQPKKVVTMYLFSYENMMGKKRK